MEIWDHSSQPTEARHYGTAGHDGGDADEQDDRSKYSPAQAYGREHPNFSWLRGPSVTQDSDNSKYEAYSSKEDTKRMCLIQEMGRYTRPEWSNLLNVGVRR